MKESNSGWCVTWYGPVSLGDDIARFFSLIEQHNQFSPSFAIFNRIRIKRRGDEGGGDVVSISTSSSFRPLYFSSVPIITFKLLLLREREERRKCVGACCFSDTGTVINNRLRSRGQVYIHRKVSSTGEKHTGQEEKQNKREKLRKSIIICMYIHILFLGPPPLSLSKLAEWSAANRVNFLFNSIIRKGGEIY